jgi:hypothetical protein
MLYLEFANEVFTPEGETVDRGAVTRVKAEVRREREERFRRTGRARRR